jgi:hypothetical protein
VTGVRRSYIKSDLTLADVVHRRTRWHYVKRFGETLLAEGPGTALAHSRNVLKRYVGGR